MAIRVFHGELPDGYSIKSFAIREKIVKDEDFISANVAKFHPETRKNGVDRSSATIIEACRHLLTEVDGVPVNNGTPYMEMDSWSDATFTQVVRAWANAFRPEEDFEGKPLAMVTGSIRLT